MDYKEKTTQLCTVTRWYFCSLLQRFLKVLFQDEECCLVKTLQWKAGVNGEALTQLCAVKFGVDQPVEYRLYCRSDGDMIPLPSDAQIQDLQGLGASSSPLVYQHSSQDIKSHKLTRGGGFGPLGRSIVNWSEFK